MGKPTVEPRYRDFREAFCELMRCPSEKYARAMFFKSMTPWRRPVASFILWVSPEVFAADFSTLDLLGDARCLQHCLTALDELQSVNRVERGFRRGLLRFRISGHRISDLWDQIQPYIKPPEQEETVVPKPLGLEAFVEGKRASAGHLPEMSGLLMRRLREAQEDIIRGVPIDEAIHQARFESLAEFLQSLRSMENDHPSFQWLAQQLVLGDEIKRLKKENEQLKAVLTEQAMELSQLKAAAKQDHV